MSFQKLTMGHGQLPTCMWINWFGAHTRVTDKYLILTNSDYKKPCPPRMHLQEAMCEQLQPLWESWIFLWLDKMPYWLLDWRWLFDSFLSGWALLLYELSLHIEHYNSIRNKLPACVMSPSARASSSEQYASPLLVKATSCSNLYASEPEQASCWIHGPSAGTHRVSAV